MAVCLQERDVAAMLRVAAARIGENCECLSRLDAATGDGDHGSTMNKVAQAIVASLAETGSARALLEAVGWSVMSVDGGSASPLLGSFFMGMAEGTPEVDPLNGAALAAAFEAGLAKFRAQTPAQVGDKTMLDALVPAIEALRAAAEQDLAPMLAAAAEAAAKGAESTKTLQARFGRARNLGPRSIGWADPGATSIALLFAGFRDAVAADERETNHG